jgi:hypothetical protein
MMNHIRIYEAFESKILGKTLAFINKESQESFKSKMDDILSKIDFPMSELSDEFFQYLPFRKALNLNSTSTDEPCDATSEKAFPEYQVTGEKCDGGMVKRKWGSSIRKVNCPICGGTGVRPKTDPKIKWVKFWFDKDGKYVETTVTDGIIRKQPRTVGTGSVSQVPPSKDLSDYVDIRRVRKSELRLLPSGTLMRIRTDSHPRYCVAVLWIGREGTYAIQDHSNGGADRYSQEWRKYGNHSWSCTGEDTFEDIYLIKPKSETSEEPTEETTDPYEWNAKAEITRKGLKAYQYSNDMENLLKNAHFALVMDYDELTKMEYTKRSETKEKRSETKKDTLAFKSDEEIRKANIDKYMSELAKRITITEDLTNMNQMIIRVLGWSTCGYNVLLGKNIGKVSDILTWVFEMMKSTDQKDKETYANTIKKTVENKIRENSTINEEIISGFQRAYKKLQDSEDEMSKKYMEIIDEYHKLNREIYTKIKETSIETLEDLEILNSKIRSIYNTFESGRYQDARRIRYFLHYVGRRNPQEYLESEIGRMEYANRTIEELKRLVTYVKKI